MNACPEVANFDAKSRQVIFGAFFWGGVKIWFFGEKWVHFVVDSGVGVCLRWGGTGFHLFR